MKHIPPNSMVKAPLQLEVLSCIPEIQSTKLSWADKPLGRFDGWDVREEKERKSLWFLLQIGRGVRIFFDFFFNVGVCVCV